MEGTEEEIPDLGPRHDRQYVSNWGTEVDENQAYHNGNSDPRGFGHLGIAVPDVYAACKRFEELGVKFVKKVDDGKMKGLAFIQDPDGYWIEILSPNQMLTIVPSV